MTHSYQHKVSIVIVNYNVEYFLEQCLNSVEKALKNVNGEVLIVDNNSIDNSVAMVRDKFPQFTLIENKKNVGFSIANNQAMKIAKGEYILLLNPDTVVEEDGFEKVIHFMDEHPDAGCLGVKMVDGKGRFLPESKRGLPTPMVAFWKLFGFSNLFPKSKIFAKYHLGYLDKDSTHKVQILCGAYMFMRAEALDKVGLLDEAFFMYGEDIDLSYRIEKGGYNNYYYPETSIIHYKGESTKKSSVNYVIVFYKAMVIFAQKHFSQKNAKFFSFLIHLAIYLRAGAAILSRFLKKVIPPLLDGCIIALGMIGLTRHWANSGVNFPDATYYFSIPLYAAIWLTAMYFHGTYDRPFEWKKPFKGVGVGTLIILVLYALMPKDFQFSRLYIFVSAAWTLVYLGLTRSFLHLFFNKLFSFKNQQNANFAIVGSKSEAERIEIILKQTVPDIKKLHWISSNDDRQEGSVGTLSQLDQVAYIKKLDEIIFSAKDTRAADIIEWMKKLEGTQVDFKIAQPDTLFLIGSNSIDTAGDLYLMHVNKIEQPTKRRTKRVFDMALSGIALLMSPILVFGFKNKLRFVQNMWNIFIGKLSVVGYYESKEVHNRMLPKLKLGVLKPTDVRQGKQKIYNEKLNLIYARDYSISKDIVILRNCWRNLDRSPNDAS